MQQRDEVIGREKEVENRSTLLFFGFVLFWLWFCFYILWHLHGKKKASVTIP